jgi:hypothetical protein
MKTILEAVKDADEVEVDALFALLKYKSIGILRKLKCMALVLDINEETVLNEAPKDKEGRILDHETRHAIHNELIIISKQYQKNK